jgi:hypothetical protein
MRTDRVRTTGVPASPCSLRGVTVSYFLVWPAFMSGSPILSRYPRRVPLAQRGAVRRGPRHAGHKHQGAHATCPAWSSRSPSQWRGHVPPAGVATAARISARVYGSASLAIALGFQRHSVPSRGRANSSSSLAKPGSIDTGGSECRMYQAGNRALLPIVCTSRSRIAPCSQARVRCENRRMFPSA